MGIEFGTQRRSNKATNPFDLLIDDLAAAAAQRRRRHATKPQQTLAAMTVNGLMVKAIAAGESILTRKRKRMPLVIVRTSRSRLRVAFETGRWTCSAIE